MRIRNTKDLDYRIRELKKTRDNHRKSFFSSSDKTRSVAGAVQSGMYIGQLALGAYRTLSNYHVPPRKRIKRVVLTLGSILLLNALRKKLVKKTS